MTRMLEEASPVTVDRELLTALCHGSVFQMSDRIFLNLSGQTMTAAGAKTIPRPASKSTCRM